MLKSPGARAAVEKRVTDWAGQYYHLNSLERNLTAVVPFYNWTRHALRFGKEQVLARPAQSAVLSQIGALGDKEAKKELGNLPDFLKGLSRWAAMRVACSGSCSARTWSAGRRSC